VPRRKLLVNDNPLGLSPFFSTHIIHPIGAEVKLKVVKRM